jgi:hypothetical protein
MVQHFMLLPGRCLTYSLILGLPKSTQQIDTVAYLATVSAMKECLILENFCATNRVVTKQDVFGLGKFGLSNIFG